MRRSASPVPPRHVTEPSRPKRRRRRRPTSDRKLPLVVGLHDGFSQDCSWKDRDGNLTNEAGEVTSHLQGMFNRTIRLLEAGIKPVYVFDGKLPGRKICTSSCHTISTIDTKARQYFNCFNKYMFHKNYPIFFYSNTRLICLKELLYNI